MTGSSSSCSPTLTTFTVPEAIAPKASLRLLDKGAATSPPNSPLCLLSINDQASPCAQIAGSLVHRTYRSSHERFPPFIPGGRPGQAIRRRYAETGLTRGQPPGDSACSPPNLEGQVFVVY